MRVDKRLAMEVAFHEAVITETYKDSVGVLTWSVGLTNATGHNVERYIRNPATMQDCIDVYVWALERYADDVEKAFAGHRLTQEQFAAAVSFHYNTGAIARASWVRSFKAGHIEKSRAEFMNWSKPSAIIGRRKKERDLFFEGKWSGDGTITHYTRVNPNLTPVWSSAKRTDISKEFDNAFAKQKATTVDYVDDKPVKEKQPFSWWQVILDILKGWKK
jgi:lysozyme